MQAVELDAERAAPPTWVLRFTRTERLAHWVQAVSFLTLLVTGLVIGLSALEEIVGHRALLREIHLWAAFLFVFGPSLVALAGNRRAAFRTADDIDRWTADDARWLLHPAVDPAPDSPPQGRFNAGQKLNALFTAYSTVAFGVTGLILWQNRRFPFEVVSQANTIHSALAYLALAVFLGHLYLAVLHPATRQAFHGMVFGTVRRSWAEHHHPLWRYADAQEGPLRAAVVARTGALFLVLAAGTLLLVRFGLEWLGANTTDAVTSTIYRISTLPGSAQPATGSHVVDLIPLVVAGFLLTLAAILTSRRTP